MYISFSKTNLIKSSKRNKIITPLKFIWATRIQSNQIIVPINKVANIIFRLFIHLPDVGRNFKALGKISINIYGVEKPKAIKVNVKK